MTLPQGGFNEHRRAGRRRVALVGALVLAAMFAWGYLVVSCDVGKAGDDSQARAPEDPSSRAPARAPAPEDPAPEDPAPGGSVAESSGVESPAPEGQAGDAHAGGARSHSTAHPLESKKLPPDELREFENRADQEAQAPSEPSADPAFSGPSSASAPADGSATYDPLGTGAQAGDLAPIDEERARFAAAEFVTAAYGYSGDDKNAYNQGVGDTVVWPDFYDSEGSKEIERYAAQVEETGTESAAKLSRFRVEETTGNTASGYGYFETGAGYDEGGGLAGKTVAYRQGMSLMRVGETWKVLSTEKVEEM